MSDLEAFAENIFLMDGPPVHAAGIPFPTRMIIVQLADGALWVNSPVHVTEEAKEQISDLGPVKYLVSPTKLHLWRLEEWHGLFPEAELWGTEQVPDEFKHLPLTGVLDDVPSRGWAEDIDQVIFRGNLFLEEAAFLHKRSRTLIVADFIQNHVLVKGRPLRNTLYRLAGVVYPNGGVPLDIRLSTIHRSLARQAAEKLLSWDFDKLIIAHGVCLRENARPFVERAFRWLVG